MSSKAMTKRAEEIVGFVEKMIRKTMARELEWKCIYARSECDPAGESSRQIFECGMEDGGDEFRFTVEREAFLSAYSYQLGKLVDFRRGNVALEYFIKIERNGLVSVPRSRISEEAGRALFLVINPSWKE